MIDLALSTAASYPGPVAFDSETDSKHWWVANVGVCSFAWGPGDGQSFATRNVAAAQQALQYRMDAGLPTILHNSGFDMHVMARRGLRINWKCIGDTLLLARLANNLGQNDLGSLARVMLGEVKPKDEVKAWLHTAATKKGGFIQTHGRKPTYLDVPDGILLPYATQDARLTIMLYPLLCQSANMALYERERELRRLMFDAETAGIEIDPALMQSKLEWAQREHAAIKQQVIDMRGLEGFNPGSDAQVRKWLYEDLGLTPVTHTETGTPQVDEYNMLSNPHPATRLLVTLSKREKTVQYLESYLELRDEGNRLHPTINTMQARTHRFSCSDPNLQQIPVRKDRFHIREGFTAGEGYFIGADFSKQELFIAACEANEEQLLYELGNGLDPYVGMGRAFLGKEDITDNERNGSKVGVLAILYGAGAPTLAETFTKQTGKPYSLDQARAIRSGFKEGYPELDQMMQRDQAEARSRGYLTNRWGRRLNIDPQRAYVATDYRVQSQGRDVLADAIFNVAELLPSVGGRIVLPIHDEIVMWVPSEPSPVFLDEIAEAMTCRRFQLPLTASPKYGRSLAELK